MTGKAVRDLGLWYNTQTKRLEIPVFDEKRYHIFNKSRRDPLATEGAKYLYPKGTSSRLFNIQLVAKASRVIVCEGELDAVLLYGHGFIAVSSTGGAGTFLPEWAELLRGKEVIICYDTDKAGMSGALRVQEMIPWAKIASLPNASGKVKDVTDYCMQARKSVAQESLPILLDEIFGRAITYPLAVPELLTKNEQIKMWQEYMVWGNEIRAGVSKRMQQTIFIDRYLEICANKIVDLKRKEARKTKRDFDTNLFDGAKKIPMTEFMQFNGRGFTKCPFHAEKSESFHYIPASNKAHCFGCNKTADVIEVVARIQGINYLQAAKLIAKV